MFGLLIGCSPALDWREIPMDPDGRVRVQLPCRSVAQTREVVLAGRTVTMLLNACEAGGTVWSVARVPLPDAALARTAASQLRKAAAANIDATIEQTSAWRPWSPAAAANLPSVSGPDPDLVPSAAPASGSAAASGSLQRWQLRGRLPNGKATTEHLATVAIGTSAWQFTVLGPEPPAPAVQAFFDAIQLR